MSLKYLLVLNLLCVVLGKERLYHNVTINREDKVVPSTEDKSWIYTWEASETIRRNFIYYISGYDYEGRAILVLPWGVWDTRSVVEKGGDNRRDLEKHLDQLVERIIQGVFSMNSTGTEDLPFSNELAVIIDFDDLDFYQLTLPENLRFLVKMSAKIDLCFYKIGYGYIINANTVAQQLIDILRPTFGRFLERLEVFGTMSSYWKPRILRSFPPKPDDEIRNFGLGLHNRVDSIRCHCNDIAAALLGIAPHGNSLYVVSLVPKLKLYLFLLIYTYQFGLKELFQLLSIPSTVLVN
ncbi:unnamed protein product [Allacma fusca]|uniref:CRAL-TRIO domain-containing protein n=1 Tax=Allacma fusca TaxID=39272 RepID=A0A8J2LY50_9HEXA|nr:unnamed protein product [Allacma fusca]